MNNTPEITTDLVSALLKCVIGLLVLICVHLTGASAQSENRELDRKLVENAKKLDEIRKQITVSESRKQELAADIENIEKDRATINRQLIETSTRTRRLEGEIEKTGLRIEELGQEEFELQQSLRGRRSLLAEVLAALQRMGQKPPPALLVTPEDALSSVRSAILLGAVVPEIRAETSILFSELSELTKVRDTIIENQANLLASLQIQAEEEERLDLLLNEKQKIASEARSQLVKESAKIAELAANATSLNRLIDQLEGEIETARKAAEAARLADEKQRQEKQQRIALGRQEIEKPDFSDASRLQPAIGFADAKGLLPRPVSGVEITSFGQEGQFGVISNGLSMATRASARIIAPADAWVVYAGPFRSYGQLLIMNAGSGYHIVLAGMEKIHVGLGQFVLTGEPVGIMGSQKLAGTSIENVGSTRPVLYVEFRKDGKSIDPSPWWLDSSEKRVSDDS